MFNSSRPRNNRLLLKYDFCFLFPSPIWHMPNTADCNNIILCTTIIIITIIYRLKIATTFVFISFPKSTFCKNVLIAVKKKK